MEEMHLVKLSRQIALRVRQLATSNDESKLHILSRIEGTRTESNCVASVIERRYANNRRKFPIVFQFPNFQSLNQPLGVED